MREDQLILTLDQANRDFVTAQLRAFGQQNGVRVRIREERGNTSSLCIIDLRGDAQAIDTVKQQAQLLLSQQTLVSKPARRLSRPVMLGLSFLAGLLGITLLRLIATALG